MYSIIFPHLGIKLGEFPNQINIGNFSIAFYGILIAIGIVIGCAVVFARVKKTNQYADDYVDMIIFGILAGIVGARLYYVAFSWNDYKDNLLEIFNLRNGGLAIYGTIIGAFISTLIVSKVKKISFLKVIDTCAPGFLIGQAIGRWGNFFNREAFGGYTDSLFAMQIKQSEVTGVVNKEILSHLVDIDGTKYIQVHPTFLYESLWCILILVLILIFRNRQKYNGQILLWYIGGYALGRVWIEGLRTDQLVIGNSNLAVSQLLSLVVIIICAVVAIINRIRLSKGWQPKFKLILEPGDVGTKEYAKERIEAKKKNKKEKKANEWERYTVKDKPAEEGQEEPKQAEESKEETATEATKEEPKEEIVAEAAKEETTAEVVKEEATEEKIETPNEN